MASMTTTNNAAIAAGLAAALAADVANANSLTHTNLFVNTPTPIVGAVTPPPASAVTITNEMFDKMLAGGALHGIKPSTNAIPADLKTPHATGPVLSAEQAQELIVKITNPQAYHPASAEEIKTVLDRMDQKTTIAVAGSMLSVHDRGNAGGLMSDPGRKIYYDMFVKGTPAASQYPDRASFSQQDFQAHADANGYSAKRSEPAVQVEFLRRLMQDAAPEHSDLIADKFGVPHAPKTTTVETVSAGEIIKEKLGTLEDLNKSIRRSHSDAEKTQLGAEASKIKEEIAGVITGLLGPDVRANGVKLREEGVSALRGRMEAAGLDPNKILHDAYRNMDATQVDGRQYPPANHETAATKAAAKAGSPLTVGQLLQSNPAEAAEILEVIPDKMKTGQALATLKQYLQRFDHGDGYLKQMETANVPVEKREAVAEVMFSPEAIKAAKEILEPIIKDKGASLKSIVEAFESIQGSNPKDSINKRWEAEVYYNHFVRKADEPTVQDAVVASKLTADPTDVRRDTKELEVLRGRAHR